VKRLFDAARARLSLLVFRRAAESRAREEFDFHLEMATAQRMRAQGLDHAEARRQALASFGGVTQHGEELREGRGLAWLGTLSLDARLAVRMLRKTPALTAIAVVGLSIAVAIGSVCFSAVYRLVDTRLPVSEGDRVIGIRNLDKLAAQDARATHLHFLALWRQSIPAIAEFGAYRNVGRNVITSSDWSESARVAEMTASGFRIARVAPLTGRYLVDGDERPDAPPVAVIAYRTWQQRYAGRPDILGRTIQIGDTRHTIVGVMPDGFAFPVNNRIWIPLRLNPAEYPTWHAPSVEVFGRLAPGATLDDAREQAAVVGQRLASGDARELKNLTQRVIPYTRVFIDNGDAVWTYHLIQLIVTLLLVVIGTNVAVLVYARTASRMGEIAIRTSLGASRARIVSQLFAEAFVLSVVAAGFGLLLAWLGMMQIEAEAQRIVGEQLPYWFHLRITPGVAIYAVALAVIAAVIIGVVPALKVTGAGVRTKLSELSAGGSNLRLGRPWTAMIVAQVAVAVAVLPLAIGGVSAWRRADAAAAVSAAKEIATATVSFDVPERGRMDSADFARRHVGARTQLIERLKADPRVAEVVMTSHAPGEEMDLQFEIDPTNPVAPEASQVPAAAASVQPEYFGAIGIPVLAGRAFNSADINAGNVVIVNRSFMKRMFGGGLAVGSRIRVAGKRRASDTTPPPPWTTIVGVVADFPIDSGSSASRLYWPLATSTTESVMLAIKMNGTQARDFFPVLREHAIATNPSLRLDQLRTLDQVVHDASASIRLMVAVVELITLSTILLCAAGIYALMSFTITRRRREIGIRSALGAAPRRLLAGEISRVMSQIAIGILIGIVVAGSIDHLLEGGWSGRKGLPGLVSVAVLMLVIGVLSALRPAIGALRIQPTEALRAE
jgi:putative ABC transport system permease protein